MAKQATKKVTKLRDTSGSSGSSDPVRLYLREVGKTPLLTMPRKWRSARPSKAASR